MGASTRVKHYILLGWASATVTTFIPAGAHTPYPSLSQQILQPEILRSTNYKLGYLLMLH